MKSTVALQMLKNITIYIIITPAVDNTLPESDSHICGVDQLFHTATV